MLENLAPLVFFTWIHWFLLSHQPNSADSSSLPTGQLVNFMLNFSFKGSFVFVFFSFFLFLVGFQSCKGTPVACSDRGHTPSIFRSDKLTRTQDTPLKICRITFGNLASLLSADYYLQTSPFGLRWPDSSPLAPPSLTLSTVRPCDMSAAQLSVPATFTRTRLPSKTRAAVLLSLLVLCIKQRRAPPSWR